MVTLLCLIFSACKFLCASLRLSFLIAHHVVVSCLNWFLELLLCPLLPTKDDNWFKLIDNINVYFQDSKENDKNNAINNDVLYWKPYIFAPRRLLSMTTVNMNALVDD